jgi:uncharacterized protein DUF6874
MILNWHVSKEDGELLLKIAQRAADGNTRLDTQAVLMDLTACHANGNPLRLKELLEAELLDFTHDVYGIMQHIDRSTGKLTDFFTPRFSVECGETGA